MSNDNSEKDEAAESTQAKPTITIAEKHSGQSQSKPTITIAERPNQDQKEE